MTVTSTKLESVQQKLAKSNPQDVADVLKKVGGKRHALIKVVVTGLAADDNPDITGALVKAAAVVTGIDALAVNEYLPPVGKVLSLRVTASATANSLGTYGVTDKDGAAIIPPGGPGAAMGIAKIDDAGKTITFPNTITGFVLQYEPRSETAMTEEFAPSI